MATDESFNEELLQQCLEITREALKLEVMNFGPTADFDLLESEVRDACVKAIRSGGMRALAAESYRRSPDKLANFRSNFNEERGETIARHLEELESGSGETYDASGTFTSGGKSEKLLRIMPDPPPPKPDPRQHKVEPPEEELTPPSDAGAVLIADLQLRIQELENQVEVRDGVIADLDTQVESQCKVIESQCKVITEFERREAYREHATLEALQLDEASIQSLVKDKDHEGVCRRFKAARQKAGLDFLEPALHSYQRAIGALRAEQQDSPSLDRKRELRTLLNATADALGAYFQVDGHWGRLTVSGPGRGTFQLYSNAAESEAKRHGLGQNLVQLHLKPF